VRRSNALSPAALSSALLSPGRWSRRPLRIALTAALLFGALWPQGCNCDEDLTQTDCNFTVAPGAIDFGEVEVDNERARAIVIENTGNVLLSEFNFEFAERNSIHYRHSADDDFQVLALTEEAVQVVFAPLAESTNLGSVLTVSHPEVGGDACPAFQITIDGASFERIMLPDGGPDPDGGDGDGDGDGDGGVDGGDGDGDGDGDVPVDAGPVTPPDAGVDPDDTLEWQTRGALQHARSAFAAINLSDGTLLVVGGYGANGQAIDSLERFDPETGISTVVGHTAVPRAAPGATELPSGRVAIVGGVTSAVGGQAVTTIEIWDPGEADPALSVSCVQGQGDCLQDDIDQGGGLLPVGRLNPLVATLGEDVDGGGPVTERIVVLLGTTLDTMGDEVLATGGSVVDLTNPTAVVSSLSGADSLPPRTGELRAIGDGGNLIVAAGVGAGGPLTDVWILDADVPSLSAIAATVAPRIEGAAAIVPSSGDIVAVGGLNPTDGSLYTDLERIVAPFGSPSVELVDVQLEPRVGGSLVALAGDVLLVAGGADVVPGALDVDESVVPLTTAELLVPFGAAGFLRVAPDNELATPRYDHRALPFGENDDGVVFLGGVATTPRRTPHPAAERYRLDDNAFEVWGLMGQGTAFEPLANNGDGALLTAGGIDPHTGAVSGRARAFVLDDDTYVDLPALASPRRDHSLTRLSDNAAYLVAGGRDAAGQVLATASIYVPLNPMGFDEPLPASLNRARADHTATLLDDGRVLLCGGVGTAGEALDTCEVFTPPPSLQNPATYDDASFALAGGRLSTGRVEHTSTLLDSGEVLLLGGGDVELSPAPADLFDPTDDTLSASATPSIARRAHASLLLGNGRVLVVGGEVYVGGFAATESAEVFERQNEIFIPVGSMTRPRIGPSMLLFADGSVLVMGGAEPDDEAFPTRSLHQSERYTPDPFGLGVFDSFDLPLAFGRSAIAVGTVFGGGLVAGGDRRDGALGTGAERRTPLYFVERLVDLTEGD
jgi:hypothetical protein